MSKQASVTIQNLESAFAGESMAHIKYRYFAKIAREQGDEDVARVEPRRDGFDEVIHRPAGRDHQQHFSRTLDRCDQRLQGMTAFDALAVPAAGHKLLDPVGRRIEDRDRDAFAGHVEGQVLAHQSHANESDLRRHRQVSSP